MELWNLEPSSGDNELEIELKRSAKECDQEGRLKYNELKMKKWERFKPVTRTRLPDPNSLAAAKKAKVLAAKMQWLATRALAPPAKISSNPSIPFVAGKSTSKSHNLGIAIQETKSLMRVQLKSNIRQKPPCFQTDVVKHEKTPSTVSVTNINEHVDDMCPVLKYNTTKIINNKYDEEAASQIQNQTIEEIWANYMYEVESNNMIPLRCTCFPRSKPKPKPIIKKRSDEDKQALQFRKGADPKSVSLYIEAQRTMEECFEKQKTPDCGLNTNCTSIDENNFRRQPPKSKELADCMQKIKRIQEQLYQTNILMNK